MTILSETMPSARVEEAISSLCDKEVRSTTLERLRLTREADALVDGLPQPRQLGDGVYHLLDRTSVPVAAHDLILGRTPEEVPDREEEAFFQETLAGWNGSPRPSWMKGGGHECFAWPRLLRLGLPGLEDFATRELERRTSNGADEATLDFLRGSVRIYQAFRNYACRYAAAAREAGLIEPAARCGTLSLRPPQTFAEALQLIWLVGHPYCTMLTSNPTLTFGRLDEMLLPFYEGDLAAGRLCREEAGDLIEDFYCKNNLVLGRGEHQMGGSSDKDTGWARNLTYDAPQYIVLAGRGADGTTVAGDLTELFLERIVPRFENPVVVVRYTTDMPEPIWRLACDKMRANASAMVYNDEDIVPAMVGSGIADADAVTYTMHGCNWPDIPGIQMNTFTHFLVLPKILREALLATEDTPGGIDGLYTAMTRLLRAEIDEGFERARADRATWDERVPGILRVDDCFLDGPIARARSWQLGGVRYNTIVCSICGIATTADGLAAIQEGISAPGAPLMDDFGSAAREDFADSEALRQRCLNAPKFGQDDDRADRHAVRVLDLVLKEIDRASRLGTPDEVIAFRCMETDMRHLRIGTELGATPDGRRAGDPISENTSPVPGSCRRGPTAMFKSLAKLPFNRINSGALNLRLQPKLFAGEAGLTRLATLLRTYFDLGGLQVQLSLASVEQLRDAQIHPERHRDLMVRITGYSAAFVDMTRTAQDEIIRREELGA